MAVHHQQAAEMSFIVRDRTGDEDVRRLAYDTAQTQANQRGMLLGWLDLWSLSKTSVDGHMTWVKRGDSGHSGHEIEDVSLMPGMATNAELDQLGRAEGMEAEILYLQLLTDHHMGGADMDRGRAQQFMVPQERPVAGQGRGSAVGDEAHGRHAQGTWFGSEVRLPQPKAPVDCRAEASPPCGVLRRRAPRRTDRGVRP